LAPDAPVDVLVGGGGGGGAGVVVWVGVGVDFEPPLDFVEPEDPVDFLVVDFEPLDFVELDECEDPLLAFVLLPLDFVDVAPVAAGATPVIFAVWAWSPATVLRRASTWAEFAAIAFWRATTCGSSEAAGAADEVLAVVEVTGW
jgi:hypothetical protein